jgi:hypothetical protein
MMSRCWPRLSCSSAAILWRSASCALINCSERASWAWRAENRSAPCGQPQHLVLILFELTATAEFFNLIDEGDRRKCPILSIDENSYYIYIAKTNLS